LRLFYLYEPTNSNDINSNPFNPKLDRCIPIWQVVSGVVVRQIYAHYKEWEDYQNGMYEPTTKDNEDKLVELAERLLKNPDKFYSVGLKMIGKWIVSANVNLTNKTSNRRAWIGQASCCFEYGVPEVLTRIAWGNLDAPERMKANAIADKIIKSFEDQNKKLHRAVEDNGLFSRHTGNSPYEVRTIE